ncbi:MAG: ECF transporter S component [Bacillota bacterium]|jgi:uncharacterized membrane protein
MKITTARIARAGLFAALALVLGATQWGFIPIPTPAGAATVMHVPVILAGILEGPLVGGFVGLLFGLFTIKFGPAWVVIPPRLLIGPGAWLVFVFVKRLLERRRGVERSSMVIAAAIAGFIGSAINTGGICFLAAATKLWTPAFAWLTAVTSGIPEGILAAIVAGLLVVPLESLGGQQIKPRVE